MNPNKSLAAAAAVAFLAGVVVGRWVVPAVPESPALSAAVSEGMPPGHEQFAAGGMAEGHAGHGAPAEGAGCSMDNCSVDRPALEARLRENPKDVEALLSLGSCDLDMGDTRQGIERLSQATILAEDAPSLVRAGVAFSRAGEAERAITAFEKALVDNPKDTDALYRAGLVSFHNLGNKEKTISYWSRYVDAAPAAPNAELIRRSIVTLAQNPGAPSGH